MPFMLSLFCFYCPHFVFIVFILSVFCLHVVIILSLSCLYVVFLLSVLSLWSLVSCLFLFCFLFWPRPQGPMGPWTPGPLFLGPGPFIWPRALGPLFGGAWAPSPGGGILYYQHRRAHLGPVWQGPEFERLGPISLVPANAYLWLRMRGCVCVRCMRLHVSTCVCTHVPVIGHSPQPQISVHPASFGQRLCLSSVCVRERLKRFMACARVQPHLDPRGDQQRSGPHAVRPQVADASMAPREGPLAGNSPKALVTTPTAIGGDAPRCELPSRHSLYARHG